MQKKQLHILKIGGNIVNDAELLAAELKAFSGLQGRKILVHGGGKKASAVCSSMGIVPKMVAGRRITDAPTLEVVTMVYAGLINKKIVAQLQALNCDAIGLSGADGNCIQAKKRSVTTIDYGFAGDIISINKNLVNSLLAQNIGLVFCSITHNQNGQLLNTNADTIATQLAIALADVYEVHLQFQFGQKGVLEDVHNEQSYLPQLSKSQYVHLKKAGIIFQGMIPKLDNAFEAKQAGVQQIRIAATEIV
ncbi:MAG: acetylglutamate kinase [Bacteroidota bacterium]